MSENGWQRVRSSRAVRVAKDGANRLSKVITSPVGLGSCLRFVGVLLVLVGLVLLVGGPVASAIAAAASVVYDVLADSGVTRLLALGVALGLTGAVLSTPGRPERGSARTLPGGGGVRWAAQFLILIGACIWCGSYAATGSTWRPAWLPEPLSRLPEVLDWLPRAFAWLPSALAWLPAALLGLAALYALHRLQLVRLARGPGPIVIPTVTDATGKTPGAPVVELTTVLRRHLAEVNLYPQSLIPGASTPQDFVAQVESAASGKNTVERVARLLRVAMPTHAYRIHCAVMQREGSRTPYGISVQVQLLPGWMSTPTIHWAATWGEALETGAYSIAETILPWTRQARRPPWAWWMGEEMPAGLMAHYERAQRKINSRQYDEALGELAEALRLDPVNLDLRMDVAGVQQKLALWMDALENYVYVEDLARQRLEDMFVFRWRRKTRAIRRSLTDTRILAHYRKTILLGWGDLLANQWLRGLEGVPDDSGVKGVRKRITESEGRVRDKHLVRARLELPLRKQLQTWSNGYPTTVRKDDTDADPQAVAWGRILRRCLWTPTKPAGSREARAEALCLWLFFQLLAVKGRDRRPWLPTTRRVLRPRSLRVTATSRGLIHEWTLYRLRVADGAVEEFLSGSHGSVPDEFSELLRELHRQAGKALPRATRHRSLAEAEQRLESKTRKRVPTVGGRGRRWFASTGSWLDHYNAACTYLAPRSEVQWPLPQPEPAAPGDTTPWPRTLARAIRELERAMSMLRPDELAAIAPWVCSEDPDLAPIRDEPAFARFAARQFPSIAGEVTRPPDAHLMELTLYTSRGLAQAAWSIADAWQGRIGAPPSGRALDTMRRQEATCWNAVADVTAGYTHWETRLRVTREMDQWALGAQVQPFEWRYPVFDAKCDKTLRDWEAAREAADLPSANNDPRGRVRCWVESSDERLRLIQAAVADQNCHVRLLIDQEKEALADATYRGAALTDDAWKTLASSHARMWTCLAEWLSEKCLLEHPRAADPSSSGTPDCTHGRRFIDAAEKALASCSELRLVADSHDSSAGQDPSPGWAENARVSVVVNGVYAPEGPPATAGPPTGWVPGQPGPHDG